MKKIKILTVLFLLAIISFSCKQKVNDEERAVTKENISHAEKLIGISFSEAEKDSMLDGINNQRKSFEKMREVNLPNKTPYVLKFNPIPAGKTIQRKEKLIRWDQNELTELPEDKNKLAFYTVPQLAYLIKNQKITSTELTKLFLRSLKKYSDTLNCLITLTEERALQQAQAADKEIKKGKYRGMLHGIPYGLKDLVSVE